MSYFQDNLLKIDISASIGSGPGESANINEIEKKRVKWILRLSVDTIVGITFLP